MRTKTLIPNLNNATPGYIVDTCAPLTEEMNRLKKLTDYLKTGLKARLSDSDRIDPLTYEVVGEEYGATISTTYPARLSLEALMEKFNLTEDDIRSCYVQGEQQTVRFYKLEKQGS